MERSCTGDCDVIAIPHNTNYGMGVVPAPNHRVVILDNVIHGEHSQTVAVRFDTDRQVEIVGYQPFGHGSFW